MPAQTWTKRFVPLIISAVLAASLSAAAAPLPQRIVSLSLCTDQLLQLLVPGERIAALSYMARRPDYSPLSAAAQHLPFVTGKAEEVLLKRPDLVVASTWSTRPTIQLLRRLGLKVESLPPAADLDGIVANLARLGALTGRKAVADRLIAKMRREAASAIAPPAGRRPLAVIVEPNGYTPGTDSLADWLVRAAGFRTFAGERGFRGLRKLSLERLVLEPPDALILTSRGYRGDARAMEIFQHPALERLRRKKPSFTLDARITMCGTPLVTTALAQLAAFRHSLTPPRAEAQP